MFFQSFASVFVGVECAIRSRPFYFFDTIGAPFSYPVVKTLTNAKILAYVHYPIISSDMLQKVREQRPSYNNASVIATSVTISHYKLQYYQLFAKMYCWCGSFADVTVVNSSWTRKHIEDVWNWSNSCSDPSPQYRGTGTLPSDLILTRKSQRLSTIFPPCNTKHLHSIPLARDRRQVYVLSIGQFRPEKDHMLQIRSLFALRSLGERYHGVTLVLAGSTRHKEDEELVKVLRRQIEMLELPESAVRLELNLPYAELVSWMSRAQIGLHTMWNEHFGISVVEMMAAGLVVVAHNSGGPKMDIINTAESDRTGYLAATETEYAAAIAHIVDHFDSMHTLQERARRSTERLSDEVFVAAMVEEVELVLRSNK